VGRSADLGLVAARQDGAFNRRQAWSVGYSNRAIERLLSEGSWSRLDDHVFAHTGSPATWRRSLRAAVLSRPVAYAAGRSAARLHGFSGLPVSRPEILVPFDGNARSPLARVIRSRHFDRISHTLVEGFETTTEAETILTLSFTEPTSVIGLLVDHRLAARTLRIEDFDPILDRLSNARVRGLPGLRRIVGERDRDAYQPPTSELERLLYLLLEQPGVPSYTRQMPIRYPSRDATVDAFIPDWRLITEADGRRWHTKVRDFEVDRARDNAAAAAGLQVVRFTYSMLTSDFDGSLDTLLRAGSWRDSA
jgi:very-short-patch-repair endonuclease